jgi:hypothetical protein
MISSIPLLTGLAMSLLCCAWASILLPLYRLSLAVRILVIVFITLLVMLPLSGLPGWYYVRGVFGDSSVTALFFYATIILQQYVDKSLFQKDELLLLRWLTLAAALLLYPFALGLTQFDSYRLGYDNLWLLVAILLITLFCWLRTYYFLALIFTAAVIAFTLQLLESRNLWDYLLDPLFVVAVILTWRIPRYQGSTNG